MRVRRSVLGKAARLDALAADAAWRGTVAVHLALVLAQAGARLGCVKAAGGVA